MAERIAKIISRRTNERDERFIVAEVNGQRYSVLVQRNKRVRIPYKPRGTYGWTWCLSVMDASARRIYYASSADKSIGVDRALECAGVIG